MTPLQSKMAPSEVIQWSNHRVMEWLRSVDLAEYAANLRGSGVHGGLLVSQQGAQDLQGRGGGRKTESETGEEKEKERVRGELQNH